MAKKTSIIGAGLSELEKAFQEAQAIKKAAKVPALPLNLKRSAPKTKQQLQLEAERVARQMMGEHVTSGKKGDTKNLAGRSMKEAKRVQALDYKLSPTQDLPEVENYTPSIGEVKLAVPGDQTISDRIIDELEGLAIGSEQQGGSLYGLGKMKREKPLFWASNEGPAGQLQGKVDKLSQLYNTDLILGEHLAMGSTSNNFAMHMADANLKAFNSANVHPAAVEKFNEIIREGYQIKNPKTGEYKVIKFPDFPGIDRPNESYLAMMQDPEMRKFFNARAKTPAVTEPLGLPNGLDVEYAATEPALRNMEINLTGNSVGRLKPGEALTDDPDHDTYLKGIVGDFLGKREVLTPFKISYPDAADYVMATQRPQDFTGTIQKVFPHQTVDQQYLDEYNTYRDFIKKYTGKAKGGKVGKAAGILQELNKAYEEAQALKAAQAVKPIAAPTIIVPKRGKIKDVMENVRKTKGDYHARRVERAADEVPNLEHQYTQGALESAFTESNPQALMVMNPKLFEEYANPLPPSVARDMYYLSNEDNAPRVGFEEYIKNLENIARDHGFADVPYLSLSEAENGGLRISGHEGRHRNRALTNLGDEATLIRLLPRYNLTDSDARRYKQDYLDALNARLGLDAEVQPEIFPDVKLALPKIFKDGGRAKLEQEFVNADTVHMAEGGYRPVVGSPYGKGSGRPVTPQATLPDLDTIALTGKILAKKGAKQLKKELANPTPQMAADILGNLAADIIGMPSDLIEGAKGEPINTKGRNKPYNTSTMQQSKGKRMLGSENIRDQLKNAGITSGEERPLTEMGLGLISPAAIAKGPKLAKALGKEAARRIEQNADNLGLKSYVVKPEGGQWSDTARWKIEDKLGNVTENKDIKNWLQTTGRKYILNRMGSPEDEVRKMLDKDISHLSPTKLSQMGIDINQNDKDFIRAKRRIEGFPQEGLADTAAGKRWELMTDEYINPNPASVYQDKRFTGEAPWAENLDPDTRIYSGERGASYMIDQAGMHDIASALERAIKEKKLKPEQLNKVSMEDAVKLAHEQRVKDETEIAKDLPKLLDYPEAGLSWHSLSHDDPEVLRKILKREGDTMQNCIGNYCEDITEDGTKLFSLRDKAGNPHVNIEMKPVGVKYEDFKKAFGEEKADELLDRYSPKELINLYPEFRRYSVKQIKGKQNEAPVREYIPYVQDFLKNQGPFESIDDLSNAKMIDLRRAQKHGVLDDSHPTVMQELGRLFPAERDQFGGYTLSGQHGLRADTDVMLKEALKGMEGNYVTADDIINHLRTQETRPVEQGYSNYWKALNPSEDGMARGGQPKSIDLETQFRLADILTR